MFVLFAVASEYPEGEWLMIERSLGEKIVTGTLALKLRNLDALDELAERLTTPGSPDFRDWRSMEELNEITRPSAVEVRRLLHWLSSFGLEAKDFSDFVSVKGPIAKLEAAFHVKYHAFQHVSRKVTIHRAVSNPVIPKEFHNIVNFITGIANLPYPSSYLAGGSKNPVDDYYVVPETLRAQYGVPTDYVATNPSSSQGVAGFGPFTGISFPDLKVRKLLPPSGALCSLS